MRLIWLALAASRGSVAVSPVQKVVELLQDLKAKVSAELEHEASLMSEYTQWCGEEANAREDAISHAERSIRELTAVVEDSKAQMQALAGETAELASQISAREADLARATGLRKKEEGTFTATEKELVDTVDTLERAIVILKRAQTSHAASFLQRGLKADPDVRKLLPALAAIVQASWVDSRERAAVQTLMQGTESESDEDLSLQPQASVAAYEGHGQSIIEVLQDMQAKAEAGLSDARKTEMDNRHAFEMLAQTLNMELKQHQQRMDATTGTHTEVEEALHAAEGELAAVQKGLAEDKAVLAETKSACSSKQAEWKERQQSAQEEMDVIAKAQEILESAPGVSASLVQATRAKALPEPPAQAEARKAAGAVLIKLSQEFNLYSLSQLAASAETDPFEKVRAMIEQLIERLIEEAGQEADAKAFCDTEMSKSKAKQEDLVQKVDKHHARIEKAVAAQATLKQQVTELQREIAELDAAQAEATKLRQEQHSEYEKATAENKASASAIADAMQVLSAYYNGASLLQTRQPALGGKKTDVASTILEILEVAEQDFTRLVAEGEATERAAQQAFDKLSQDSQVLRAAKTAEVNAKAGELKSFELSELNYKEDYRATSKELDAVLAYLDELKPQCETKVQSFADRTARREAEIAGLKEALQILEQQ